MEIYIEGQILLWERLELMIATHAQNVINGTGMRTKAVELRQVISGATFRRLRNRSDDAIEAAEDVGDEYWETNDGHGYSSLLDEVNEEL